MSETAGTLAHALLIGDKNIVDAGCSDILNDSPILAALRTTEATHVTKHEYIKEDGAPTCGFRPVNTGRANTLSTDVKISQDLKYLDPSWDKDVAIVDAYPAHKGGPAGFVQRESARMLRAAFFTAEKQILYGVSNDSDGFVGLKAASTLLYKDSAMVVDAGGTTADTGSSVWFFTTDDSERETMFVLGNGSRITVPDEVLKIQKLDGNGDPYYAYAVPMGGWFGLQFGSSYSIGRICNLTADAGKGLTDALIYSMLEKFPRKPTFMAMSRRSREQLRKSRTATNATGAPAPIPTEVDMIPIITSESIINTEALLGAAP